MKTLKKLFYRWLQHYAFIETTFDPPFGPEMMSEEAKLALGIFE